MTITYILGNGLSIAYRPDFYSLPALTATVRTALAEQAYGNGTLLAAVDSLIERMSPLAVGALPSFENYAGPLERLASSVAQLEGLVAAADDAEAAAIRRTAERVRDLYVRVVATVLGIVTQHVDNMGDNTKIHEVAEHVITAARRPDEAHVFTLNYDALLDSALLHFLHDDLGRPRANAGFMLVDDARGDIATQIEIGGQRVGAYPLREDRYGNTPLVRLYHLHGAASWIRTRATDAIVKVDRLRTLRDRDLWGRWMRGEDTHIEPVVVLGDRKDRLITRNPFDRQYASLQSSVARSEKVVFGGYGFGDSP